MKKSVSTVIHPLPFPCPGIVTDYPVILGYVKYFLDNIRLGCDPCRRLAPADIIRLPRDGMPERRHLFYTFQESIIQLFHSLHLTKSINYLTEKKSFCQREGEGRRKAGAYAFFLSPFDRQGKRKKYIKYI
jgi:hypothetical protein